MEHVSDMQIEEVQMLLYEAIKRFAPKAETAEEMMALAAVSEAFSSVAKIF